LTDILEVGKNLRERCPLMEKREQRPSRSFTPKFKG